MILKCKKCGVHSKESSTMLEAMEDLSSQNCTFSIGFRTWCKCGTIDSFEKLEDNSIINPAEYKEHLRQRYVNNFGWTNEQFEHWWEDDRE